MHYHYRRINLLSAGPSKSLPNGRSVAAPNIFGVERRRPIPRARCNNGKQGFTLLETILAILVVGVVVVLMIDLFIVSGRSGARSSNVITGLNLAQARLEEVQNLARSGVILLEGNGSNPANDFLPVLNKVACQEYPTNFYLTESDYYEANYGTTGSLTGLTPARRIDRITQIEWVDDPTGGGTQDYLKVTVTVFWPEGSQTTSESLVSYIYQKP